MALIEGPAYTGSITVDLANVKDTLVDLPPGALQGVRREQPGMAGVLAELAHALPHYGNEAEVHGAFHARIMQASIDIRKLEEHEVLLKKLLEVVQESKAQLMNNREYDISAVAAKVVESATRQKKPELMAHFEKTLHYRSQAALKAQATRKKNAQNEAAPASVPNPTG